MNKYQEALNTMCERCRIHDVCRGTGCTPREKLQELVDKATPKKTASDLKVEPAIVYVDRD